MGLLKGGPLAVAVWSTRFETGIGIIDSQHQVLFDAVNSLADSFRAGTSRDQAKESLAFLLKYAVEHFETEESFMRDMGYPALASHMAEHAKLIGKTRNLLARLAGGEPMTMEVTLFLADWLTQHIHEVDMMYVNFVKDRNRQ
jgi:hemerythrin